MNRLPLILSFIEHRKLIKWNANIEVIKMKKFISILTVMLFLTLSPIGVVNAAEPAKEQKTQYITQIKEKRQIIKQNAAENKKIELKIDEKSEELGKVIMMLFDRELPPSEEKFSQIESQQEAMLKNAEHIAHAQRSIKKLKTEASINVNEENYQQALENFDKVIMMQGKEKEHLEAFYQDLQDLIELIKSLQYK